MKKEPKLRSIGSYPVNSKIRIDYKNQKPEVKFEYPEKDHQLKNLWASSGVLPISFIFTIITLIYILSFVPFGNKQLNCSITTYDQAHTHEIILKNYTMNYTAIENVSAINIVCIDNKDTMHVWRVYQYFDPLKLSYDWKVDSADSQMKLLLAICFFLVGYFGLLYVYSKIIAWIIIHTKMGNKFFPKWNKKLLNKHYMAEFITCPENNIIELPLFKNIYLDYEAEGEFSEYLESFEILPHDFKRITRTKGKETYTPNVYLWKAVFKFSQNPKSGILRIKFT